MTRHMPTETRASRPMNAAAPRPPVPRGALRPVAAAVAVALTGSAGAATIVVDGTGCTLVDAITAANTDLAIGGCAAGDGADTLQLTASSYTLSTVDNTTHGANGLPVVTSIIRIAGIPDRNGRKAVIRRAGDTGTPAFRLLMIAPEGNVSLDHIVLRNGSSNSGGGLYNLGTLELTSSTVTGNQGSGLVNHGGGLTLRDSVVSRNRGSNGGGLDNQGGNMTLIDSIVSDNEAVYGGGLRNASGTLAVRGSTVTGNRASYDGGGLYNFNGRMTVTDSTLSRNQARYYGGALLNFGDAKLSRTTLSGNIAYAGGALANDDRGALRLVDSTVSGNEADQFGGGIVNGRRFYGEQGGSVAIVGSTFDRNSAGYGGGAILNWDGPLSLTNSTLSGNLAGWVGGAIYNSSFRDGGMLTVRNSTVSGNHAEGNGGALYMYFGGRLTLVNSIFANSIGPGDDCFKTEYATLAFSGVNLIEDGSCGVAEHGGLTGDPKLGRLLDNGGSTLTHALLAGSPALEAADDALCRKTDQRGTSRPQDQHCDIGAFERVATPAPEIHPLVSTFDQAAADRELTGTDAATDLQRQQLEAIRNQLLLTGDLLASDNNDQACEQLAATSKRIAGDGPPNRQDYVTGQTAADMAADIQDLRQSLGCR